MAMLSLTVKPGKSSRLLPIVVRRLPVVRIPKAKINNSLPVVHIPEAKSEYSLLVVDSALPLYKAFQR